MSEEEKKAIEIMKDFKNFGFATILIKYNIERVSATRLIDTSIQIILKLIEKQENKLLEYEKQLDLDYVEKNYISKDKIREKIEEVDEELLNYSETEYYLENEIKGYCIDKLKELLEE